MKDATMKVEVGIELDEEGRREVRRDRLDRMVAALVHGFGVNAPSAMYIVEAAEKLLAEIDRRIT